MELLQYLPLLNLLLVPVVGIMWRIALVVRDVPVIKQRVARLEKHAFGIDGLDADRA
ncbi:MAG: hypothetical protein KGJ21_10875 [Pseudomonadota bacterium]|nr:hypothetical protein [Pseudomonadota bacterium]